ncbi:hypothetical protein G166_gp41 [Clostridium phage phi8074-B1]|nr:hypothetical protein G166_gp41 [Clostridium phage phi8074-B1]AFC61973.1 hypothetical protein phi8074-B1_00041 [Clostridium phage phi8074-B1]
MDIIIITAYYCLAYGIAGILILGTFIFALWLLDRFFDYLESR